MQFPGEADTERRLRISETVLGGEGAEKGKMCHREREKMEDERIWRGKSVGLGMGASKWDCEETRADKTFWTRVFTVSRLQGFEEMSKQPMYGKMI